MEPDQVGMDGAQGRPQPAGAGLPREQQGPWPCPGSAVDSNRLSGIENLRTERFFRPRPDNGAVATAEGPMKTTPLRGVKDSPPYLHDGRLLTLEDTVEFFNLVLELKLKPRDKSDLVAFLRQL